MDSNRWGEEEEGLLLGTGEAGIELGVVGDAPATFPSLLEYRTKSSRSSWNPLRVHLDRIRWQPKWYRIWHSCKKWSSSSLLCKHVTYRTCLGWTMEVLIAVAMVTFAVCVFCAIFYPSYSQPPAHYRALRRRVEKEPSRKGRANVKNEQIFIVTSLYDPGGGLVSGDWADSVRGLIDILGPWNVHLSVYENDVDDESKAALADFGNSLVCNKTIVEEDLDISSLPHVTTWDGTRRLKRMQFLAEVRNRALRPLETLTTRFDKLLYINDIVFDPIDAANLLFSTNVDRTGKAQYRAACAVDFENPFKFYDAFATRDAEGYGMGVIFYPWFTSVGEARSRREVITQKDAVTVTSCWGGMVAFEAKWFQESHIDGANSVDNVPLPLRFRAENDTYWDASECCLIHADLTAFSSEHPNDVGIYMNPYIRVAYAKSVLDWLWVTRRVERLYTPFQSLINRLGGRPTFNPRRLEEPGEKVTDKVWVWNTETQEAMRNGTTDNLPNGMEGRFEDVQRTALPGAFCGYRSLSYLLSSPGKGRKKWSHERVPDSA